MAHGVHMRVNVQGLAGFEGSVRLGQGDEAVGAEGEVEAGLVAEMFDAVRVDDTDAARAEAIQVAACCLRFAAEGWSRD